MYIKQGGQKGGYQKLLQQEIRCKFLWICCDYTHSKLFIISTCIRSEPLVLCTFIHQSDCIWKKLMFDIIVTKASKVLLLKIKRAVNIYLTNKLQCMYFSNTESSRETTVCWQSTSCWDSKKNLSIRMVTLAVSWESSPLNVYQIRYRKYHDKIYSSMSVAASNPNTTMAYGSNSLYWDLVHTLLLIGNKTWLDWTEL